MSIFSKPIFIALTLALGLAAGSAWAQKTSNTVDPPLPHQTGGAAGAANGWQHE